MTARVQTGSSLPPGLSFDSNTMLIYGTLLGTFLSQSIIEYLDINSIIQGTITIVWDVQASNGGFPLIDNLVDGQTGTTFATGACTISGSGITTAAVYRGRLPVGLSLNVDSSGNFVSIVGTPVEAGYFDLWFCLVSSSGQISYLYHRLFIDYIPPLVITSSLPSAVQAQPYSFQLQAFGGVPFTPPASPYTWSMTGNPGWLSLSTSGLLTATSVGTGPVSLTVTVTDSRGVQTTSVLPLTVINAVTITTTVIPTVQVNVPYTFTVQAAGGVLPYSWSCPQLPLSGISLNASTGVISGTTTVPIYPAVTIAVTVTDHVGGISSKNFQLQTGATGDMSIDASGVGSIDRGAPYQGTLRAVWTGSPNLPVSWQIASDTPNPLPSGLILQANPSDQGTTAFITGSITTVLSSYLVKVAATDAIGNPATATLSLNTTSSLAITTTSLPQGIINVDYSTLFTHLTASGYNTPFTWSVVSSSPAWPYTLNASTGVISGSTPSAYAGTVTFKVTDSLSPADTATATLGLTVSASTLQITTASPLPHCTAGVAYNTTLTATGGSSPYTWSVSPLSSNPLPSGFSISGAAIVGTTTYVGTTSFTIRVTDHIGAYYDKTFSLTIISGLALHTGVDYTDSISTNYLGYVSTGNVSSISPRGNSSFYVIATGVITTSTSTLASGITLTLSGSRYSASVDSIVSGVARIRITGPFSTGASGDNNFGISVTDSGVTATATFKWKVYNDGTLRAVATNAFPTQLVSG